MSRGEGGSSSAPWERATGGVMEPPPAARDLGSADLQRRHAPSAFEVLHAERDGARAVQIADDGADLVDTRPHGPIRSDRTIGLPALYTPADRARAASNARRCRLAWTSIVVQRISCAAGRRP